jgi:hypothetical protein
LGEIGPGGDKIRSVVEVVDSYPTGPWVCLGLFVAVEWKVQMYSGVPSDIRCPAANGPFDDLSRRQPLSGSLSQFFVRVEATLSVVSELITHN